MALITCFKCGNQISDKSEKCIHCGTTITSTKIKTTITIIVITIITIAIIAICYWIIYFC